MNRVIIHSYSISCMDCAVALVIVDSALDKFYLPMLTIIMNKESIEYIECFY